MIVVDTSVLIAILQHEPEADIYIEFVAANQPVLMSAVSLQEAGMIMRSRRGPDGVADLFDLIATLRIGVAPYDEVQARAALEAFGRYGKGIQPTARLNLGDCAVYALASTMGARLLFKGDDFAETDVRVAR